MNRHLKDYYKVLGLSPGATTQDIKKAYRSLAFRYHPDQNPDNAFAEASFKELQEAYVTLSHAGRRRAYDEERWLMGMSNKAREQQAISPQWIMDECIKLARHMATIDTYRMSHNSLRDYIFLLLSEAHMGILLRDNDTEKNVTIIQELLKATQNLQYRYMTEIAERLLQLAGPDVALQQKIAHSVNMHRKQAGRDKYFTFLILVAALLLALFMYFYGRKR